MSNSTTADLVTANLTTIVYSSCTAFLSVLLNGTLLWLITRLSKKTYSTCLTVSIAIAGLLVAIVQTPLAVVAKAYSVWPLGKLLCYVNLGYSNTSYYTINLTLVALAWYRLSQIAQPFVSDKPKRRRVTLIFACWIVSLAYNVIKLVVLVCKQQIDYTSCQAPTDDGEVIIHSVLLVFLPVTLALLVNLLNVFKLARKSVHKDERPVPIIKINSVYLSQEGSDSSTTSFDNSRSYRRNDSQDLTKVRMSKDHMRRDQRSVLCLFGLCLAAIVFELSTYIRPFVAVPLIDSTLSGFLLPALPLANPLVIFAFNKKLRNALPWSFAIFDKKKVVVFK